MSRKINLKVILSKIITWYNIIGISFIISICFVIATDFRVELKSNTMKDAMTPTTTPVVYKMKVHNIEHDYYNERIEKSKLMFSIIHEIYILGYVDGRGDKSSKVWKEAEESFKQNELYNILKGGTN